MALKPSIPKGTRDFSPTEVAKRTYITNIIKLEFQKFGFQPIETPSFENSETLMGKYGDEGDRLIFKILNSGDFLSKFNKSLIAVIKESLIFLSKELNHNVMDYQKINWDDCRNNYSSFIPNYIKTTKSIQITEEKISYNKLAEDLWNIIYEQFFQDALTLRSFLKKQKDENSDLLTFSIFGKFYEDYGNTYMSDYTSEKALRYDLTVPFARYVVQHQNDIEFPFKRYQIQPVWRADRPQKGRFREFFQCDADVVGSQSLFQEVEFIQLYDAVFTALQLNGVSIKMNNRKVLSGFAEVIGASDKLIDFTVALDKLDKIGEDKVKEEMLGKGISEEAITKIQPIFNVSGSFADKIKTVKNILNSSKIGLEGITELEFIEKAITQLGLHTANLDLDVTLARGLNYYTGAIFEVSAPQGVSMGSIGGGGRYDDLTGIFGLKHMSGIGISFGLDRIYLVLEALEKFPETVSENTQVLFINFGDDEALFCLNAIKQLRMKGVNAELYPDAKKLSKQFDYANKRNIPFTVVAGSNEIKKDLLSLKNMATGEQKELSLKDIIAILN